ncbi:AsmA family protein [Lysobacter sp. CFH 32150]|uniref:AsmA family protein n=1 Tax=Lysobacter sp. CFH 32150 TaxID=2927128 RepID=UPI001FA79A05|nr:AsmA family protein [Lysobacter sp. CFH 32150]MCI4568691.1 AsmA family protein [Lysobacter sp. CFH 32150]
MRVNTALASLRRHPWWSALAVFALAIVALIALWDWNWFKGPIERQVQARTGRTFTIGGDLDVDLDWKTPTIRADAVHFGNATWSKEPTMASADRVEFEIEWRSLVFRREVHVPGLRLSRPQLHLEMGPGRVGNWKFGEPGEAQAEFRSLWIDDGQLRFLDGAQRTDITVDVHSERTHDDAAAPPVLVVGSGRWQGNAFKLDGRAESPLELRNTARPYRIDARASAGATHGHARGTLLDPLRLRDFDLRLALSGKDLADLYPLFGIATPTTPPYRLDGRFTREVTALGNVWHYDGFSGKVGDSDLGGNASIETGRKRPYLRARLTSRRLDFDDLAGFVGKAPQAGGGEATNPELAAQAARESARTRVLPDQPYELEKLRSMDADVRWTAHRINAPKLPLDDMDAHLLLENGLLRLQPLNFGVADGDIRSTIRMDAREAVIRTNADIAVRGLNLPKLLPTLQLARDSIGKVGGDVQIAGSGNSIAQMLGSSDGDVALGMGQGQISNLLMEWAGIDIAEALKFMVRGDRKIPIRCAFGDFSVDNGVMTARALAFDTSDTIIVGEGDINLRDETLNLKLRPRPKDRSLLSLRSPLLVGGTFKDPSFRPDYGRLGLRSALALALGNIAPPAALLATLELGPGEDSNCGGRYAK